jgi:GGDEF domain-containing protein
MRPLWAARIEDEQSRGGLLLCLGLLALLGAYVAQTLAGAVEPAPWDDGTLVYNVLLVAAAACCAARGLTSRAERIPWVLLGLAAGVWATGDIYYTFVLSGRDEIPFPSVADGFYLAFYPLAYVALALLLRGRVRQLHGSLWLDGIIGGLVVSALGAAVVFDAVLDTTGGSKLVVATNLAYPLLDLLLFAMLIGVIALNGWRLDRTWLLVAAGFASFAVADSVYLYETAAGTYVEGKLVDVGWVAASVLFACAAWQPPRRIAEARNEGWQALTLPTAFAFVGLAVLVYDHFHRLNTLALVLAWASLAAVILRAVLTFRDKLRLLDRSRLEALTDSLTSLGNRRRFLCEIEDELRQADARHPLVLILFDLDGFKLYNDTFGHPAGDVLLMRLAGSLEAAVSGRGRAYRMGGDEFCVIGSAARVGPGALVDAAAAALT